MWSSASQLVIKCSIDSSSSQLDIPVLCTALAVLYNGEAPKHNIQPLSGGLQHQHTQQLQQHTQQQQHQQTLPGYHYSVPTSTTPQTASATSQHAFAGYRYNTPASPTTTTTEKPTTTTTVRPPVTAAATQASTAGYFYSPPAAAGHSDHTFYPPYYQQTHHAPALAISSDTNVQQQLPLSDAPTYFVPHDNRGKVEVPQATHPAQQAEKELHRTEVASPAYDYPRPASGAELAAEPLTTYQRVFHEFADYLIWQRAQAKQREQQQQLSGIATHGVPKSQATTLPHLTQGYVPSIAPQFNYPAAHKQFSFTASSSNDPQQAAAASSPTKTYPQSAAVPPRNVFPQYAANFVDQTQVQALAQRRPAESSALLAGERYIPPSPNSAVEYLEMPSESWELPSYTGIEAVAPMAAVSNSVLGFDLAAAQPDTGRGEQPKSQMFYDAAAQQNAQYLYERENRFVQTTPGIASGETKGPQEEKVAQVQQQHAESAQRYLSALQQQNTPTDISQSKLTQPSAVQFAQIPQWPQNLALQAQHHQQRLAQQQLATQQQQEQQRPLYNRVVAPLMPTAQLPVSVSQHPLTLADQQQENQPAKQQFYLQAQQQQIEPQSGAATAPSRYTQNTQLAAQPTQPSTADSSSNSDSHSHFHLDTNVFRRPHSSYGVPSENSNTGGYNYQRPVGQ
ncbi:chromatin modification-related protein EAF1-like [Rhagoletis pomonella]|uniref:chromatin modification-related protein EAF1-like n=1 Tax=Rhagoletis pomonella TaxID=28610 RepID=UPI0017869B6E|nr:chromatin modification-related protein EAF1-like [Rhagoletis pomonella]